jgi:hypothetical protein
MNGAIPPFPVRLNGMVHYQSPGQLHRLLNKPLGLRLEIYDNVFYIIAHTTINQLVCQEIRQCLMN